MERIQERAPLTFFQHVKKEELVRIQYTVMPTESQQSARISKNHQEATRFSKNQQESARFNKNQQESARISMNME